MVSKQQEKREECSEVWEAGGKDFGTAEEIQHENILKSVTLNLDTPHHITTHKTQHTTDHDAQHKASHNRIKPIPSHPFLTL